MRKCDESCISCKRATPIGPFAMYWHSSPDHLRLASGRESVRNRRRSNSRCGADHDFSQLPMEPYSYLLGLYLGDGCISASARGVWHIRITLDSIYPKIVAECRTALEAIFLRRVCIAAFARAAGVGMCRCGLSICHALSLSTDLDENICDPFVSSACSVKAAMRSRFVGRGLRIGRSRFTKKRQLRASTNSLGPSNSQASAL
jgi:hypothetical protein